MPGVTNLRLEPERIRILKDIAHERAISLSALMREMADEIIRRHGREKDVDRRRDPIFRLGHPGVDGGPVDGAENHDYYLYGFPKKRR